jgi:hypothetical protein
MKKIVVNSPRRTGSSYITALLRQSVPNQGELFFEKLDPGYSLIAKMEVWKSHRENQIQVALVRDPYDYIVSVLESKLNRNLPEAPASRLLTEDKTFLQNVIIELKLVERYYKAMHDYAGPDHLVFDFNDLINEDLTKKIIDRVLISADIDILNDESFELVKEIAMTQLDNERNNIRLIPDDNNESYDLIKAKLEELKESISFNLANEAYQLALSKSIKNFN